MRLLTVSIMLSALTFGHLCACRCGLGGAVSRPDPARSTSRHCCSGDPAASAPAAQPHARLPGACGCAAHFECSCGRTHAIRAAPFPERQHHGLQTAVQFTPAPLPPTDTRALPAHRSGRSSDLLALNSTLLAQGCLLTI